MTSPDLLRLRATLGLPALGKVRSVLQRRLEAGRALTGRILLQDVSPEERSAIDNLVGRRPTTGGSLSLDLDELARRLREAGVAESLTKAIEALEGPVVNRLALAAETNARWATLVNQVRDDWSASLAVLLPWLENLASSGVLKRLSNGDPAVASTLLTAVGVVARSLPVQAEPLPHFAARLFGDAHALDAGSPRATLAVRAAACLGGTVFDDTAEGFRAAWAVVGVMCDELSTPALVLNLPARGMTALAQMLRLAAGTGDPLHLSLRTLLRQPLSNDPGLANQDVFVCENPSIVGLAASRWGANCAPLVCVNGQFATSTLVLIRQLQAGGARLRYHGDFDLGGLMIARRILGNFSANPWRYSVEDYLTAPKGLPLAGDLGPTPWSPHLAEAMRAEGRAVHEEAVAESLLQDLGRPIARRAI